MSEHHRFVLACLCVAAAFFLALCLLLSFRGPRGYHVVTLNGVDCLVLDGAARTGGETTELDQLRCPSVTQVR